MTNTTSPVLAAKLSAPKPASTRTILAPDYSVFDTELNRVRNQIVAALPKLQFGFGYSVEKLYGKDAWKATTKGAHLRIGRCVAHLVRTEGLNLHDMTPGRKGNKLYCLKAQIPAPSNCAAPADRGSCPDIPN